MQYNILHIHKCVEERKNHKKPEICFDYVIVWAWQPCQCMLMCWFRTLLIPTFFFRGEGRGGWRGRGRGRGWWRGWRGGGDVQRTERKKNIGRLSCIAHIYYFPLFCESINLEFIMQNNLSFHPESVSQKKKNFSKVSPAKHIIRERYLLAILSNIHLFRRFQLAGAKGHWQFLLGHRWIST